MYSKNDAQNHNFAIVNYKRIVFPIANDHPLDRRSFKIIMKKIPMAKKVIANGLRLPILMIALYTVL